MKTFNDNAMIVNDTRVDPFKILAHAIRRDQKSVVVIEEFEHQNVLWIASSDNIHRTIQILEEALSDLRERVK
jgi:hypothetical protein